MESVEFIFGLLRSVLAVVLTPLLWSLFVKSSRKFATWEDGSCKGETSEDTVRDINHLADRHEVGAALADLIQTDGAGSWPPRANHDHTTWPEPLRPYKEIYFELAPLLSVEKASLDDEVNRVRIVNYRAQFRNLLAERVDLDRVKAVLETVERGSWDVISRDTYNAFYCCISSCRHAYRWGTIPVVRLAQLERIVDIPTELDVPWGFLQRHFDCVSQSGNNTSMLVLNFEPTGKHVYKINTGLPERIRASEEAFSQIFFDVEVLALPIYHSLALATVAYANSDLLTCLLHMTRINKHLPPVLKAYYDRLHDAKIARSAWLSHVQGFFAWGAGEIDPATGRFIQYDGLSGNQALLFIALDSFLGLDSYLPPEIAHRNIPRRQREFAAALSRHSFRADVERRRYGGGVEAAITKEFSIIVKRLRLFRTAHRTRAKTYLSQPAPERLPMTAGKSLLKSDIETSLEFLDEFMVGRLKQTV